MFTIKTNQQQNPLAVADGKQAARIMERVKNGESFQVVGDRMENEYRFDKVDSQHWALCWNNLIVAVATAGNFFLQGFLINMRVLGQVSRLQVLTTDIRFKADRKEGGRA